MNPYQFSYLVTSLANVVATGLNVDELAFLAAFFVQLGDTLATIVTSKSISSRETG